MSHLFLLRHGNTFEKGQIPIQIGSATDLPLTSFGRTQAAEMASYLKKAKIHLEKIFSGPLKRQLQTAEIISEKLEVNVEITDALSEIDYGLWEGKTSLEILKKWPKEYQKWTEQGVWIENVFQGERKNLPFWLKKMFKEYEKKAFLLVTSQGALRSLQNEKVGTGHFCEVSVQKNRLKVVSWNRSPGLYHSQEI